ncbi:peptidase M23 [Psychromonas sp. psych-6C06]|uniref:peptidoglycan DD-metalloendopeptidase family protein n=1 Tax=Psychromonas sp. psych-6C06 TaxID=2058089 RepID=UPI000C34BCC9|nr:peptidoglycan DD-metalloendopeptidase family protein [Psychromonas sp. psych-6C06]PKF61765.1 peptidase M23 [Psychromonas sp. psych-6C06]
MFFLNRIKAFFTVFISFINNLPRKHFFALIILFVCLLVISFLPSQSEPAKNIKRPLTLPVHVPVDDGYAKAVPATALPEKYGDTDFDFSGKREIVWTIKEGDSLSTLFQKEGLSAAVLHALQEADKDHLRLGNLLPGQEIKLLLDAENQLLALKIKIDFASTLSFVLKEGSYVSFLDTQEGEWRNSYYEGNVTGSFYINAKQAGLSAGQIQQISSALQEKFDFNRQLRIGDTFHVLVSKQYIDGQYTYDSEVLAVLIKTNRQTYSAFLNEDGRYYDEDGKGLGKAYRRSPLDGRNRISSSFNPRRLHPVTKRISPHNGTDFAVGIGTKVYSIGDGVVQRAGYHPAAGNYIVIKHGRKYTTRYLHLSKIYVSKGQRVKMGRLIAKSGNTGRSTGPHLHYEFHIYGKPVNAMKVNLPLSQEIPKKNKKAFNARRDGYLKEMNES